MINLYKISQLKNRHKYLQKCKKYHDDWLTVSRSGNPPICRIDANHDVVYNESDDSDRGILWLDQIGGFIDYVLSLV